MAYQLFQVSPPIRMNRLIQVLHVVHLIRLVPAIQRPLSVPDYQLHLYCQVVQLDQQLPLVQFHQLVHVGLPHQSHHVIRRDHHFRVFLHFRFHLCYQVYHQFHFDPVCQMVQVDPLVQLDQLVHDHQRYQACPHFRLHHVVQLVPGHQPILGFQHHLSVRLVQLDQFVLIIKKTGYLLF